MLIPPTTLDGLRRECRAACHESHIAEGVFLSSPTQTNRTRWLEALIVSEAAHIELIKRLQRQLLAVGPHREPGTR